MRKLRIFSIILFMIALALFMIYRAREISLQDRTGPEISMDSREIYVSINDPEEKLLEGVSALDRRDGDVTDSLVVESLSTFLRSGTRIVRYAAFDQNMHVARAEREMTYTDYRHPEFSIKQPLVFSPGNFDLLRHVKVSDCLDGSLTDSIKILSDAEFLVDVEGDYEIRFQASNSAGDVAVLPVVVHISENQSREPKVMMDDYVVYLDPGAQFDPFDYVTGVTIGGGQYDVARGYGNFGEEMDPSERAVIGTQQIEVDNPVDTSVPGNYTVIFRMSVKGNNGDTVTGETRQYVVVRETAAS